MDKVLNSYDNQYQNFKNLIVSGDLSREYVEINNLTLLHY
jgi:hypothetical protein